MSLSSNAPMLEGIKIIDLTTVVFGPYCTQILADLGAEVIKIEQPTSGDVFRYSGKPAASKGMSPGHLSLNRNKKSVLLNLKETDDKAVILKLIEGADIVIHNIRSKAIKRLGLDYETLKQINPEIIYVHCVGFGSDGPYSNLQAYDDVIQAASGATSLAGKVDGMSGPKYIPSLIADKTAGLHAVYATQAAIIHKLRTGEGQFVEVPMFEAFAHFILKEHLAGNTFEPPNAPACYPRQIDKNRQPFPTQDGHISIVPYTHDSVELLFELIGAPELKNDARFNSRRAISQNMTQVYAELRKHTPKKSTEAWLAIFSKASIPSMPIMPIDNILEDPHLNATGFFIRSKHPTEGDIVEMREPSKFSAWQVPCPSPAPKLGENSVEIKRSIET